MLFGQQIRCIYTQHLEQQARLEKTRQQNRDLINSDNQTNEEQQNHSDDTHTDESNNEQEQNKHKKRPTKVTITGDYQIIYNTDTKENTNNQIKKAQIHTKRQVNKHLTNNTNITQRKKQKNANHPPNTEQIWIDNLPPPVTEENFPQLDTTTKQQKQKEDENQQPTTTQQSEIITIIQETPISQQPQHDEEDTEFLGSVITSKPNQSTLDPMDLSTPIINENKTNTMKYYHLQYTKKEKSLNKKQYIM